ILLLLARYTDSSAILLESTSSTFLAISSEQVPIGGMHRTLGETDSPRTVYHHPREKESVADPGRETAKASTHVSPRRDHLRSV
ncbi:hypothetical protein PENTCL1PPCAC_24765, partial [Pristionchus entomophagus]